MAVSPDGHYLATGTNTGGGTGAMTITQAIHVFDAATGQLLGAPLDGVAPLAEQHGLAYTPDGRFLIVGHADQKLQVVHLIDAKRLEVVDMVAAGNYVEDVAANPRSSEFAAAAGRQVIVWSLPGQH
jgi:DNA-binding beta-propeller fold protein YncE